MTSDNLTAIITTLCSTLIPAVVTVITFLVTQRKARRDKGGLYILMLIMQDQFNWEFYKELPANFDAVNDEYADYHEAGGNGKVTAAVNNYRKWHSDIHRSIVEGGFKN